MSIVEPPLIQTPQDLVELAFTRLKERYPNFNPNPADPQWELFLAFAYIAAETIILAFDVPEEIIRFVGEVVYQTAPEAAVAATAISTWEALDSLGHTLDAGTEIELVTETGERVGFETTQQVVIPVGSAVTGAGQVPIKAIEPGAAGNIVGAFTLEFVEPITWVKTAHLLANPSNGVEEETTEEYTKRIRELASLIKPQPILPEDFGNIIRLLVPGLRGSRVLSIDMMELSKPYGTGNTTASAEDVERCVTVIPILSDGTEPSEALQREAYELLTAKREASFKSFVGSPTYHPISIKVHGTFLSGYNQVGTEEQVRIALEELLSPAKWASPPGERPGGWAQKRVLRYQDVISVLNNVPGFGHYTTLEVNGGTSDVNLTGIAPLTTVGTLTISLEEGSE